VYVDRWSNFAQEPSRRIFPFFSFFFPSPFVSNWTRFQLCQQKLQKKDKNYFSEKISEKMLKVDLLRESSVFQK
jgi:hypothetical protein